MVTTGKLKKMNQTNHLKIHNHFPDANGMYALYEKLHEIEP